MVSTNSERRWRHIHLYEGEVFMKFQNITVTGIVNVVIERRVKWTQLSTGTWQRQLPECLDAGGRGVYTHEQMMSIIAHLKEDRRYRMWVHGDTLNIVRKQV